MIANSLAVVAIIGFFGQIFGQMLTGYLTQRAANRAQKDAEKAQLATIKAAEDASKAQEQAAHAARMLVESAKDTDVRLDSLKSIAQGTHILVNNQRTVLLRLNASLARRIARENPDDKDAQVAALAAQEEASRASTAAVT